MGNYNSDQRNSKFYGLKLSRNTDADIIDRLESVENIQGYIKQLIRADISKGGKKTMKIQFESGTSRHGSYGVNFLSSLDGVLYAECEVPEGASDDYGYFALKREILRQAAESNIPAESLEFWYDGQEQYLEADASADCEVK